MTGRHTGAALRARRLAASLVLALALAFGGAVPADAARTTPDALCQEQQQALESVQERIDQHNAEPHVFTVPDQQAQLEEYDAEADQLNTEHEAAKSRLEDCTGAMQKLEDASNGGAGLWAPTPDKINQIQDAANKVDPDRKPGKPDANGYWRVPPNDSARSLYNALRSDNPPPGIGNTPLQGTARPNLGDRDPAYPPGSGATIGPNRSGTGPGVSADHIVPLAEVMNMPGFMKLTPQNMYVVTRAPVNFQWLSTRANYSKSSRSAADITGVDPSWSKGAVALEDSSRQQLQDLIQQLLRSQG